MNRRTEAGFTLVELIVIVVIVGVLAVFAAPRFFNLQLFQQRGFADQATAAVRYAQKAAVAQRRNVCVNVGPVVLALTIAAAAGAGQACNAQMTDPSTLTAPFVLNAPSGVVMSATSTSFKFDGLGRPNPNQAITLTIGSRTVTVEPETGYVH